MLYKKIEEKIFIKKEIKNKVILTIIIGIRHLFY